MDPRALASAANPRVIACLPSDLAEREMSLAGVHSEGTRIMASRAAFLVLRVDNVAFGLARRVKEIMLSMGADAAIAESAWSGVERPTPLIIMGTRRQFKDLLKSLAGPGEGIGSAPVPARGEAALGDAAFAADLIARTLDNYSRDLFTLRLGGGRVIKLGRGAPLVMGIVNATPDSFSDGGRFLDPGAAVDHAVALVSEGAGIVDVGGESTRPGSSPVPAEEEIARVVPVIKGIRSRTDCPISIDTSKSSVARAALDAGADIINDITAMSLDPAMAPLAAEAGCPVVLMHMKGTPRTMQQAPFYRELMGEIIGCLRDAVERAVEAGVDREQIVVDPGIGFGKSLQHNLEILRRLKEMASLGRPILVGPSRKGFIGKIIETTVDNRATGTAAVAALAAGAGAHIIRAHDAAGTRESIAIAAAIAGA